VPVPNKLGDYTWTAVYARPVPAEEQPALNLQDNDPTAEVLAADDLQTDDQPTDDQPTNDPTAEDLESEDPTAEVLETDDPTAEVLAADDLATDDQPTDDQPTDDQPADNLHQFCAVSFTFTVEPHRVSLAVWDTPLPVIVGSKFTVKAGARCSAACKLDGEKVVAYDQQGTAIAEGILSDDPWQGTTAMFWTELELTAPDTEDFFKWEFRWPQPDEEATHTEASYPFAFRTAYPPEHQVVIECIAKDIRTPLEKTLVTLHKGGNTYRDFADEAGVVKLMVPKGEYLISAVVTDYKEWEGSVVVNDDTAVLAEMKFFPET
jgi:hypothetical protein